MIGFPEGRSQSPEERGSRVASGKFGVPVAPSKMVGPMSEDDFLATLRAGVRIPAINAERVTLSTVPICSLLGLGFWDRDIRPSIVADGALGISCTVIEQLPVWGALWEENDRFVQLML